MGIELMVLKQKGEKTCHYLHFLFFSSSQNGKCRTKVAPASLKTGSRNQNDSPSFCCESTSGSKIRCKFPAPRSQSKVIGRDWKGTLPGVTLNQCRCILTSRRQMNSTALCWRSRMLPYGRRSPFEERINHKHDGPFWTALCSTELVQDELPGLKLQPAGTWL